MNIDQNSSLKTHIEQTMVDSQKEKDEKEKDIISKTEKARKLKNKAILSILVYAIMLIYASIANDFLIESPNGLIFQLSFFAPMVTLFYVLQLSPMEKEIESNKRDVEIIIENFSETIFRKKMEESEDLRKSYSELLKNKEFQAYIKSLPKERENINYLEFNLAVEYIKQKKASEETSTLLNANKI